MIDLNITDFVDFSQSNPLRKSYMWKTQKVQYDNGQEQRNEVWSRPLRKWNLNWSIIDETERNHLIELFQRAKGMYETFKLKDWDDYAGSVTIPDGTSGTFQLTHAYYSGQSETWTENKTLIVADSITIADYTEVASGPGAGEYSLDDNTGIVTFGDTVSGNKACTFEYYFLVRFDMDALEDQMPHCDLYQYSDIPLVEVLV